MHPVIAGKPDYIGSNYRYHTRAFQSLRVIVTHPLQTAFPLLSFSPHLFLGQSFLFHEWVFWYFTLSFPCFLLLNSNCLWNPAHLAWFCQYLFQVYYFVHGISLSNAMLKSIGDSTLSCLSPVITLNCFDTVQSTLTWYLVPFMHIFVRDMSFLGSHIM